jgi:hypothetical protein
VAGERLRRNSGLDYNALWGVLDALPGRRESYALAAESVEHGHALRAGLQPVPPNVRVVVPRRSGKTIRIRNDGPEVRAVDVTQVRAQFNQRYATGEADPAKRKDAQRKAFKRAIDDLARQYPGPVADIPGCRVVMPPIGMQTDANRSNGACNCSAD